MSMTDYRSLCARMADELDHYRQLLMDDRRAAHALATEARALLDQPVAEGPTDDDLRGIFYRFCDSGDNGHPSIEVEEFVQAARAAIAADRACRA